MELRRTLSWVGGLLLAALLSAALAGPLSVLVGWAWLALAGWLTFLTALPPQLWWSGLAAALALWGLALLLRLGLDYLTRPRPPAPRPAGQGRLSAWRRSVERTRQGALSQQQLRRELRRLAAFRLALQHGEGLERAHLRLRRGQWSAEPWLQAYLTPQLQAAGRARRGVWWLKRHDPRPFWRETEAALARLERWPSDPAGGKP